MKKIGKYLKALFVLGILVSCNKKYSETLPVVQFNSVVPFGNDSAILTGTVLSKGKDDIQYVGFSYSNQPTTDILPNQILLNGTNGTFSCSVFMHRDSTYYFRSFAANSFGYAVSPSIKYTIPNAAPDSAPCPLNANTVIDNGVHFTMTYINYAGGNLNASDNAGFENVTIYFKTSPVNGIFSTVTTYPFPMGDPNLYEVSISVTQNSFTTYVVNAGGSVYVGLNNGKTTVSFCSLTYTVGSYTYNISGKISF